MVGHVLQMNALGESALPAAVVRTGMFNLEICSNLERRVLL